LSFVKVRPVVGLKKYRYPRARPSYSRLKTSIPESPTRNEYAVIALEAMFETAHLLKAIRIHAQSGQTRHFNTVRLAALTDFRRELGRDGEALGFHS